MTKTSRCNVCVDVAIEEDRWQVCLADVQHDAQEIIETLLRHVGITDHAQEIEVSVVLANDVFIRDLNHRFRGQDKATNVLSFPCQELQLQHYDDVPSFIALGDVIVALETLEKEAHEQFKTLKDHFTHMLIHGTLHLLGYDHITDEQAQEMEALEVLLLQNKGISNPY